MHFQLYISIREMVWHAEMRLLFLLFCLLSGVVLFSACSNTDQLTINGYTWRGELPPYSQGAPWSPNNSKTFVNALPNSMHQAMFFNDKNTFNEFVTRYKDRIRQWSNDFLKSPGNKSDEELAEFLEQRLHESYSQNLSFLRSKYTGLTDRQYIVLNAMNLVHGHFDFGLPEFYNTDSKPIDFCLLTFGDCSEYANLLFNLLELQNIPAKIVGYTWNFDTSLLYQSGTSGNFQAGHQLVWSEGMLVDSEINVAFDVEGDYELRNRSIENPLIDMIDNHKIYGFYNWLLKPDIRKEQLARNMDGGIIAFYYHYYLAGLHKGKSYRQSFLPVVRFKKSSAYKSQKAQPIESAKLKPALECPGINGFKTQH